MKIMQKNPKKAALSTVIVIMAINRAVCSKVSNPAGPELTDISVKWEGQIIHRSYTGGSIMLSMMQSNGNLSGKFSIITVSETISV